MPPIIACHTNSYGPYGAQGAIEQIRAAGLEYVEFPIRTAGFQSRCGDAPLVTNESTLDDLNRVAAQIEKHGLHASACTCMAGNPLDPAYVALMQRKLDLASHFGVTKVVADAGSAENDELRQTVIAHLREVGDHAAKLGITVCFETHRGLCVNHRSMLQLMEELDHPHLRLNFDTANILYYNEFIQGEVSLAKVCHVVKHVHLKDSMGQFGQWYFPALGAGGAVDFLRVFQIMRDCGFAGPYSIEIEGIEDEPELSLVETHQRVVDSVQFLRQIGYFD